MALFSKNLRAHALIDGPPEPVMLLGIAGPTSDSAIILRGDGTLTHVDIGQVVVDWRYDAAHDVWETLYEDLTVNDDDDGT